MGEYRIDDLARAAGTTSRNVRAYQDRGLLAPPRKEGRVGIYTDAHLSRLRVIGSLLNRGYATAQISELLTGWEQGKDLAEVIGLKAAISSEWRQELPSYLPMTTVRDALAVDGGDELFDRLVRLGVLQPEGEECLVRSPKLIKVFLELLPHGFSVTELVGLYEKLFGALDGIARTMVEAGAARVIAEHGESWMPKEGAETVATHAMLGQLRELALSSAQAILERAIERHMEDMLGAHLERVFSKSGHSGKSGQRS